MAGASAAGAHERFGGIVGTAAFKVLDLEVGRTGLGLAGARQHGFDALAAVSRHGRRGHAYPGGKTITTVLVAERGTGRLLGAQKISALQEDGREVMLALLRKGEVFGEEAVIDDSPRDHMAEAYEDALICIITRKDFMDMMRSHPDLVFKSRS